jgi:MFS family permease
MDRRKQALIILAATFTAGHLERQVMSVSLNAIGQEFSLSDTQLGLLSGAVFALVFAVCGIPLARLAAWYPRRIIIAISVLVSGALTILTSGAQNFAHLLITRLGVGIGEAGGVAPAHSLIADYYPEERRTSAFAALVSGSNVGVLFAFLVGGIVGQLIGWRWAFIIAGLPGVMLTFLVWRYVDEPERPRPATAISTGRCSSKHCADFGPIGASCTRLSPSASAAWYLRCAQLERRVYDPCPWIERGASWDRLGPRYRHWRIVGRVLFRPPGG